MNKKLITAFILPAITVGLYSCNQYLTGTIYFELNGGSFPESFGVTSLTGKAGDKIEVDIPDPTYDGYYFVGWYEKDANDEYRAIHTYLDDDGTEYYPYPYGNDTWYAYFEPLSTISFDLTEGAGRNGTLIAPSLSSSDFDGNVLNGYVTKSIPSESYLPTASADYLYFDYWYTKYPLVSSEDENGMTHYTYDTTAEEGEYEFSLQFGTDGMSFPDIDGMTLYAAWTEYPTVTVHMGLDELDDFSFQIGIGESVEDELVSSFYAATGLDLTAEGNKCYPLATKEHRFGGFFLDEEYTQTFALEAEVFDQDIDLYVKWDLHINVILDYNGGELNGESSHEFYLEYYTGDYLGYELYNDYKPAKEYATFQYYTDLAGNEFNFENDALFYPTIEGNTLYLVASYNEFPTVEISFQWPDGYSQDKIDSFMNNYAAAYDSELRKAGGDDISDVFEDISQNIEENDDTVCVARFETSYDGGTNWTTHVISTMPDDDCKMRAVIAYKMKITVISNYAEYRDAYSQTEGKSEIDIFKNGEHEENVIYLGAQQTQEWMDVYDEDENGNIEVSQQLITSWNNDILYTDDVRVIGDSEVIQYDSANYYRYGVYTHRDATGVSDLNNTYYEYSDPFVSLAAYLSTEEPVEMEVYRVYFKGITLKFYNEAGDYLTEIEGCPHAHIDDIRDEIDACLAAAGVNSYTNLQVDGYNLITYIPYLSSDVTVIQ